MLRGVKHRLVPWIILLVFGVALSKGTSDYVHYRLGVKHRSEGKYDLAVEEFRKVLAAYPDNYNAYMQLAGIRTTQQRYRLAIYDLKKALVYNPGWGRAQKMLAMVYERDRQIHNAIKELQDYQQVCDPAETDSIQRAIDRLILLMRGGSEDEMVAAAQRRAVGADSSATTQEKAEQVARVSASRAAGRARSKEAASEFDLGVKAYGDGVSTHDKRYFDQALLHFRRAIQKQPDHPGAYYYAGLIRRRNGQNSMAKINFEKGLAYSELGHNAHFYLGKILGEEKEYEPAIGHLKAYIAKTEYEPGKREAENLVARFQAGLAAKRDVLKVDIKSLSRDDIHREISSIPTPVEYAPVEVRIDSLLAMALVDTLSDPGRAMIAGVHKFGNGQFDDAVNSFKEVLIAYPTGDVAARCVYDIGLCYYKLHDFARAENQFQQVVDRYRSHRLVPCSMFLKAMSYGERRELARAEKLYRSFIQRFRGHEWVGKAYEKLGDTYVDLMQYGKATDAFSQAAVKAQCDMDRVYAHYKLGEAYFEIGNPSRAVASFEKAIAVGENADLYERVPDSYYKIADYYYREKSHEKALDYYKRATRKYPKYQDTPWGMFQIGSIHKNTGRYDKAVKVFNSLIEAYPDDYWARQAGWKLEDTVWEHEYRAVLK